MKSIERKTIVLTPPKSLSAAMKRKLDRNGFLVIESADFDKVKILGPFPVFPIANAAELALSIMTDATINECFVRDRFKEALLQVARGSQPTEPKSA